MTRTSTQLSYKIDCPKIRLKKQSESGMTLIEIMVVIAIVAFIITGAVARVDSSGRQIKQAVRRFSILGKDLHNRAKIFRKTYRIVLQIDEEKGHSYWVESSTSNVTLLSEEKQEELDRLTALQREGMIKDPGFTLDSQVTKKPFTLPQPLKIDSVEFTSRKEPLSSGKIYIHFFPQGLVEEAALHLSDGDKLHWTIAFSPVTGRAEVFSKKIALKEIRQYEK